MADSLCKWCGREYDGRRYGEAGWAVCSESCRQALAASVATGATEKNDGISAGGWLVRLFAVVLVVGVLKAGCSSSNSGATRDSKRLEQSARYEEPGRASEPSGHSVSSDEASPPRETEESASRGEESSASPVEESASSSSAAPNGAGSSAAKKAAEMLQSGQYSTKEIMNETGLSRREVKHIRRDL